MAWVELAWQPMLDASLLGNSGWIHLTYGGSSTSDTIGGLPCRASFLCRRWSSGLPPGAQTTLWNTPSASYAKAIWRKRSARCARRSHATLRQAQGDVDFRKGDIVKAEAHYKAAYHSDPGNARAIYGIARIFQCAALN